MRVRRDGEPSRTREAAAVFARMAPEALLDLYETALGQVEQVAPLKAERFDGLRELAETPHSALAKNPAKG